MTPRATRLLMRRAVSGVDEVPGVDGGGAVGFLPGEEVDFSGVLELAPHAVVDAGLVPRGEDFAAIQALSVTPEARFFSELFHTDPMKIGSGPERPSRSEAFKNGEKNSRGASSLGVGADSR